jgi:hypothetical protein
MTMDAAAPVSNDGLIESAYREHSRKVLATLIRLLGDFDLAEEALHDAFVAAAGGDAADPPTPETAECVSAWTYRDDTLSTLARLYAIESGNPIEQRRIAGIRNEAGNEIEVRGEARRWTVGGRQTPLDQRAQRLAGAHGCRYSPVHGVLPGCRRRQPGNTP